MSEMRLDLEWEDRTTEELSLGILVSQASSSAFPRSSLLLGWANRGKIWTWQGILAFSALPPPSCQSSYISHFAPQQEGTVPNPIIPLASRTPLEPLCPLEAATLLAQASG